VISPTRPDLPADSTRIGAPVRTTSAVSPEWTTTSMWVGERFSVRSHGALPVMGGTVGW